MRILTYNMLQGGAGRQHWSHVLNAFDPDILLAQESFPPHECGLPLRFKDRAVWRAACESGWGSAVYARHGTITPLELQSFSGWLVGIELENSGSAALAGRCLRVFSIHTPPQKVSGDDYATTVQRILDVISLNRGTADLIIGGDFNLHSLGDRHPSETRSNGAQWTTTRKEKEILARMCDEFGLANCWQTANPGIPLAQTLRWSGNPVLPYHCDGIFVPVAWLGGLQSIVANDEEWKKRGVHPPPRSDHNPVLATCTPA